MAGLTPIDLEEVRKTEIVSKHYMQAHAHGSGMLLVELSYGWTFTEAFNGLEGNDGNAPILPVVFSTLKNAHNMLENHDEWFDPFVEGTWYKKAIALGARALNQKELQKIGYLDGYFKHE